MPVVAPTAIESTEARVHPINTDRSIRPLQKGEAIASMTKEHSQQGRENPLYIKFHI